MDGRILKKIPRKTQKNAANTTYFPLWKTKSKFKLILLKNHNKSCFPHSLTIPHLFAIRPTYASEIFSESIHGGRVTYHCHAAIVTFALHWNIWEPVDRSENMLPNMLSYFIQLITIKCKNYFTHLILLTYQHVFGEKTTKVNSQESL